MKGRAIIISAPSGAGKSTLVTHLLASIPKLEFSVSACSRSIRPGETNGRDYYFLSVDTFREHIAAGDFLEWEEVYPDSFYGTLKSEMTRIWSAGKIPIFDVDVVGGLNLKRYFGANGLAVFIQPPSIEVLVSRLKNRGTESNESFQKRFSKMEHELSFATKFDVIVINDELDEAIKQSVAIVTGFLG